MYKIIDTIKKKLFNQEEGHFMYQLASLFYEKRKKKNRNIQLNKKNTLITRYLLTTNTLLF